MLGHLINNNKSFKFSNNSNRIIIINFLTKEVQEKNLKKIINSKNNK